MASHIVMNGELSASNVWLYRLITLLMLSISPLCKRNEVVHFNPNYDIFLNLK